MIRWRLHLRPLMGGSEASVSGGGDVLEGLMEGGGAGAFQEVLL